MSLDFRSFGVNGAPPPADKSTDFQRAWWKLKPNDAAKSIQSLVEFLLQHQTARQLQLTIAARHYGSGSLVGAPGLSYARSPTIQGALAQKLNCNVIQSCIDTATAKIAKNKPKPFFLTNGGSWEAQKKAKKLNRFTDGIFYENKAYDKGMLAFRDGAIWGDGIIKVFAEHNRVKWERVLPHELFVDELEGFYGGPRTLHQMRPVDRSLLIECYPGKRKVIQDAKAATGESRGMYPNIADLVMVRESWRLPSGPDAEDGAHLISIDGFALTPMEPWERDSFPFARFRWCQRPYGYWSQGGAEQIQSTQLEINSLLAVVQRATKLSGMHYWLIENGSKVAKAIITNEIGSIIPYTGPNAPQVVTPPVVPPEIYNQIQTLKQSAYEQFGISQLSASSQKPAGLDSGAALREFNDIESDRFQTIGKEYERFMLELAALSIATAKDIAEETGNYEVKVPSGRFLRTIEWSDVDLEEDQYVMQCFPISSLPNDPAGRLQTIQEFIQAGFIPQSMGPKLMQFPDLEQYESLANAMEDRLEEIFDAMVDEGDYSPPEPWFDPARSREMCLQYILRGESQDLDPERLELLQTFLSQLDVLESAAMPPPAATGQTPQAQPSPPPVSGLLPFGGGSPGTLQ